MSKELVLARASLSRLMEPQDAAGMALVRVAGPCVALEIATGKKPSDPGLEKDVAMLLDEHNHLSGWQGLSSAIKRWAARVPDLAPERDLNTIERLGGGVLIPEDEIWPEQLRDLDIHEPLCLWWRGNREQFPDLENTVAVVGSRDSTSYGASVTAEISHALASRGYCVVSGGAYGIDAHAHRAALAAGGSALPTVAVLAGGVDRFYPAGNEDLLRAISRQGAVIAEVPPGSAPTRYRFLQRNRLIAALSGATVVVEARWRSGALNTAHHAESLGRAVAAVPGSVHSANSAGCHRLIRDGGAVLTTDAAEVIELLSPSGRDSADPQRALAQSRVQDGLSLEDLIILDALPLRAGTSIEKLCIVAGLEATGVRAGLGRLQLLGLAETNNGLWKRSKASQ
ncbi:DNA-processing protein DprA [Pseudarthrobacter sp. J1738]|uniref:DNA-processing protein DprA n=1 Tax=Pseudarthrobacter sp. J1738 TaxID=3420446 RepID=UPI003D2C80F7